MWEMLVYEEEISTVAIMVPGGREWIEIESSQSKTILSHQ